MNSFTTLFMSPVNDCREKEIYREREFFFFVAREKEVLFEFEFRVYFV